MNTSFATSQPEMPPALAAAASLATEYLAFAVGDSQYGINIQRVQELRGYETVTRMANSPAFVKGVVNLRGNIVPIIDMRIQFGQSEPSYDHLTVVIIVRIGARTLGMVVDSVSDVVHCAPDEVKPPPPLAHGGLSQYLIGLASMPDGLLMLVDIERLMTSPEFGLAEAPH